MFQKRKKFPEKGNCELKLTGLPVEHKQTFALSIKDKEGYTRYSVVIIMPKCYRFVVGKKKQKLFCFCYQ
jgi:hypothetical protein